MKKLILITLALAVCALAIGSFAYFKKCEFSTGGFTSRGYSANVIEMATSGPMLITGDVQILATSSDRTYASICNEAGGDLWLSMDNDKRIGSLTQRNSSYFLADNQCYEITPLNLYNGSVRASSTVMSTTTVYEATFKDR